MMLYVWGAEPDLYSGTAEEDVARYERWLAEHAIWSAMTGQAGSVAPVTGPFGESAGASTGGETGRRPPPAWKLGQRASDDRGCT